MACSSVVNNNKRRVPPRPVSVSAMREREEQHSTDYDEEDEKAEKRSDQPVPPSERNRNARYSTRDRKALMQKIHELSGTAHMEIFRMLKREHVNHTRNKNGMFVNLSVVDDRLLDEISSFVDYCIDNRRNLEDYDKLLRECRSLQRPEGGHQPASLSIREDDSEAEESDRPELQCQSKQQSPRRALDVKQQHPPPPRRRRTVTKTNNAHPTSSNNADDGGNEEGGGEAVADVTREEEDCLLHLRSMIPRDSEKTVTHRRRANTKFALARKRLSKKKNVDKRSSTCDADVLSELMPEPYVIGPRNCSE